MSEEKGSFKDEPILPTDYPGFYYCHTCQTNVWHGWKTIPAVEQKVLYCLKCWDEGRRLSL